MKHQVDMVIISWAKDDELKKVTEAGIKTCIESCPDIQFNFFVVETNKSAKYDFPNTMTIYPSSSYGYHRYLNIGRREGNAKYVCLCNNDLTYEKDWATNLIKLMESNPSIKSASPWCPQTQGSNKEHLGKAYSGYRVRGEIAGWCLFQQRDIYEQIGDLDESFEFWFCDNDYALTLHKNNVPHVLLPESVVNHHEHNIGKTGKTLDQTKQSNYTMGQQPLFESKWGQYLRNLQNNNGPR